MDSPTSTAEMLPLFYVGEHSSKRPLPVSAELVHHAQDLGVSSTSHNCEHPHRFCDLDTPLLAEGSFA
jgi:hypothetical protein